MPCRFKPDMHHTWLSIMSCSCVVCLPCCVLLLDSSRFVAIVRIRSSTLGSSLWLHPFVFFMDSFFFLAGFQARWPYPRYHFYLYLLDVLSITMSRYLPLVYQASQISMSASNHPLLANRCLAKLPLLLSPSYSVASCRWSWSSSMLEHGYVGISQYLLFN